MKKIIAIFLVLFLATGCDGDSEMLSCSNTTTQNGIITKTGYDVEYVDDIDASVLNNFYTIYPEIKDNIFSLFLFNFDILFG